jgi:hypothetical protein
MHSSCLPAPRSLDPQEGNYTTREVAGSIATTIAELAESLDFDFETLAGAVDLTPAATAVGTELLATVRRCSELARLLELTAQN